jgi:hypothetical protein
VDVKNPRRSTIIIILKYQKRKIQTGPGNPEGQGFPSFRKVALGCFSISGTFRLQNIPLPSPERGERRKDV